MTTTVKVATDFRAGTLSDEDRETFLRSYGLTPETAPEEADRIRAEWPDQNILMAMEMGVY
ncbi:hypothetical protein [Microbacterium sp.]|uniref:hypothetical protein n=1 Tax=Microbacterium sp. TaxID=51671 RepID=UPI003F9550E5